MARLQRKKSEATIREGCSVKQAEKVRIRFPTTSDLDAGSIERLSGLINDAYDAAEAGMWKRRGTRTTAAEVERLLRARALILAEVDGVTVGSVNVSIVSEGVGELGMLAADLRHRGMGIGSALVDGAEHWARDAGCHTMRLELLTPRAWAQPSKELLKKWYSRIGYIPQTTEPLERLHPELAPELATECEFTIWHKSLV